MADVFKLAGEITLKGLEKAEAQLNKFSGDGEKTGSKLSGAMAKVGKVVGVAGKAAVAGVTAAATGIGAVTKQAVEAYATYEQLTGGVAKIFGKDAQTVIDNAANAFKTAGMSSNDYMQTVTSFSASLVSGLGGNTAEAAKVANVAITDMSDNVNTYGSNMQDVQNAYQGFAKQNYTMLDNLKLGYGGTQAEMIRLMNDSGVLKEKISSLDGVSFDQIIAGIHAIQEQQHIAGTTSKEAALTIEGSWSATKAAWQNLLTGMADPTQDFGKLLKDVTDNATNTFELVLPRIQAVFEHIPEAIKGIMPLIPPALQAILPGLIQGAVTLVSGLIQQLPSILATLKDGLVLALQTIASEISGMPIFGGMLSGLFSGLADAVSFVSDNLNIIIPIMAGVGAAMIAMNAKSIVLSTGLKAVSVAQKLVNAAMKANPMGLLIAVIVGLVAAFVTLWTTNEDFRNKVIAIWNSIKSACSSIFNGIKTVITTIFKAIKTAITTYVNAWKTVITTVWKAIKTAVTTAVNGVKTVITTVFNAIKTVITNTVNGWKNIITKVWSAIKSAATTGVNGVKSAMSSGFNAIKNVVSTLWNGIKSKITGVLNNIVSFAKQLPSKIKSGFSNIASVGGSLITGLWNGISDKVGWVISKVGGLASSVVSKIKGVFQTHSPSKVTKQIGVWVAQGLGLGMDKGKKEAVKKAANLADGIVKQIQGLKKNSKKSLNELSSQIISSANKTWSNYKKSHTTTKLDEAAFWASIVDQCKKGTQAYKDALANQKKAQNDYKKTVKQNHKDALEAEKTYKDEVQKIYDELAKGIEDLQQKYTDAVEKRRDSLLGAFNLFEKYSYGEEASGEAMQEALDSQIEAMELYEGELNELKKRIGDENIYSVIAEKGIEALPQIQALNKMSGDQLKKYAASYDLLVKDATEQATLDNQSFLDETVKQIGDLKVQANKELTESASKMNKTLKKLGETASDSVKKMQKKISESTSLIVSDAQNTLKDVKNSTSGIIASVEAALDKLRELQEARIAAAKAEEEAKKNKDSGGSVDVMDVEAHASGAILKKATIFGATGNTLHLGGEAGAEAVAPIGLLQGYVSDAVASQTAGLAEQMSAVYSVLSEYLPQVANMQMVTDTGALVGAIAPKMDRQLGKMYANKGRGRA